MLPGGIGGGGWPRRSRTTGRLRTRLPGLVAAWRPGATVAAVRTLEGGKSSLTYLVALERRRAHRGEDGAARAAAGAQPRRAATGARAGGGHPVRARARRAGALHRRGRTTGGAAALRDGLRGGRVVRAVARRDRRAPATGDDPRTGSSRPHAPSPGCTPSTPGAVGLADEPEVTLVDEVDALGPHLRDRARRPASPGTGRRRRRCSRSCPSRCRRPSCTASTASATCWRRATTWPRSSTGSSGRGRTPASTSSWFLSYVDADDQPSAIRPTPPGMPTRAERARRLRGRGRRPGRRPRVVRRARPLQDGGDLPRTSARHNRKREHPDPAQEALDPGDRPAPRAVPGDPRRAPTRPSRR